MMYLWPCSGTMQGFSEMYGVITSPQKWAVERPIKEGRWWAMDNAAFKSGFDPDRFLAHLEKLEPYRSKCLFVTVPDKPYSAVVTLDLWDYWSPQIIGWPLAFVAQNGQECLPFPRTCDWVFIGGDDDFKLGRAGETCIMKALAEGKRVHIGRVNSQKRYERFEKMGAHSCDGTGPTREPDNYKRLFDESMARPSFFRAALPGCNRCG